MNLPNLLTLLRIFFVPLLVAALLADGTSLAGLETQIGVSHEIFAVAIFLIAAVTDLLDGYLARRWKVEGVFGRVVDPFVDKVLVLGSFIFFAGGNFTSITGVVPWMVVVILARELLVTSLRGSMEGSGHAGQQRRTGFS